MSQTDLARLLGYTTQAIASWEVGNSRPSTDSLPKVAEALGTTIDYLMGWKAAA